MGDPGDYERRQFNMDMAKAGFALAGGTDPVTGKSMAGQPFLSQVGRSLAPVATGRGERLAAQRKSDQATQFAALQSGISSREAELGRRGSLQEAIFKAQLTGVTPDSVQLVTKKSDGTENRETLNLKNPSDWAKLNTAQGNPDTFVGVFTITGEPVDKEILERAPEIMSQMILGDVAWLGRWAAGSESPEERAQLELAWSNYTSPQLVWDEQLKRNVMKEGNNPTNTMMEAWVARKALGEPVPALNPQFVREYEARTKQLVEPVIISPPVETDATTTVGPDGETIEVVTPEAVVKTEEEVPETQAYDAVTGQPLVKPSDAQIQEEMAAYEANMVGDLKDLGFDLTGATGFGSTIGIPLNTMVEAWNEISQWGWGAAPLSAAAPQAQQAVPFLEMMNTKALMELRAASANRENRQIEDDLRGLTPNPQTVKGDEAGLYKLKYFVGYLKDTIRQNTANLSLLPMNQAQYLENFMNTERLKYLATQYEAMTQAYQISLTNRSGGTVNAFEFMPGHEDYLGN